MSENDYIAEYIKERYPELICTTDYAVWKFGKRISDMASKFTDTIANMFANLGNNIYEEDEENEILKS